MGVRWKGWRPGVSVTEGILLYYSLDYSDVPVIVIDVKYNEYVFLCPFFCIVRLDL